MYAVSTTRFVGDDAGQVRALELVEVELVDGRFAPVEGTEREIPAELVLLAMGFTGPEPEGCSPSSASSWTRAATSRATRRTCRRCPACSSPATRGAASR